MTRTSNTPALIEQIVENKTPKRARNPSSSTESQRAFLAMKTRASSEKPFAGMLSELEAILEVIIANHKKQVGSINLKMKMMFCRIRELLDGLSGALVSPIEKSVMTAEPLCSRYSQQDVSKADKQAETMPIRRKEASV